MNFPVIIFEDINNVTFYQNLHEAEIDIEPIDVRGGVYKLFDSTGKVLEARVYTKRIKSKWLSWLASYEMVEIIEPEDTLINEEELTLLLLNHLKEHGKYVDGFQDLSLKELIEIANSN